MLNLTLPDIVHAQDARIRAFLDGSSLQQFWFANCPMHGTVEEHFGQLHALGFDNYPMAQIPAVDALNPYLFLFERMLGAELGAVDGSKGDFFHTWCTPCIQHPDDVFNLTATPERSLVWQAYEQAIANYLHETPAEERLPVMFPGISPLDTACNLCGAEPFFLLLYEEPEVAEQLLDTIVTLQIEVQRRLQSLGAHPVSPFGFPGVYCNDLHLPSLSPAHVAHFILPRYARIAAECGGLLLSLLCADTAILQAALGIAGVMGCAFHNSLPFTAIKQHLHSKLFIIPHYCYDDALDKPTCRGGIWWNPIVQSYSRELPAVYREFSGGHSLLISIERPSLAEVCTVRQALYF